MRRSIKQLEKFNLRFELTDLTKRRKTHALMGTGLGLSSKEKAGHDYVSVWT